MAAKTIDLTLKTTINRFATIIGIKITEETITNRREKTFGKTTDEIDHRKDLQQMIAAKDHGIDREARMIDEIGIRMIKVRPEEIIHQLEIIGEMREIRIFNEMIWTEGTHGHSAAHPHPKGRNRVEVLLSKKENPIKMKKNQVRKVKNRSIRRIKCKRKRNPTRSTRNIHQVRAAAVTAIAVRDHKIHKLLINPF